MFKEIVLQEENLTQIEEFLVRNRAGAVPLLLKIDPAVFKKHKIFDCISIIEWALNSLRINPRFPYPIYLLYERKVLGQGIPVITSYDELPRHFQKPVGRGGEKVQALRQKVQITKQFLQSIDFDEVLEELDRQKEEQRTLFLALKELEHSKQLLQRILK